jgi:hypothetical protein
MLRSSIAREAKKIFVEFDRVIQWESGMAMRMTVGSVRTVCCQNSRSTPAGFFSFSTRYGPKYAVCGYTHAFNGRGSGKLSYPGQRMHGIRTFAAGGNGGNSNNGGNGGDGNGRGDDGDGSSSGRGWYSVLWLMYLARLDSNPIATKALTAGALNGFGDILAQLTFNDKDQSFDWKRLGIFTLLGTAFVGPALHVWYGTLARLFAGAGGTSSALGRLLMDQIFFAPIFIGSIISMIMTLEGQGENVPSKIRNDLFTIVKSNWVLWVPFQFINFRFVPQHLQVLASNVVALAWNTYMSWASHS